MSTGLPILLEVSGLLCVVVGGGAVGTRKARQLHQAGARVRVVSPAFDTGMPADVERITATFEPTHLVGARLVFAATDDPAVNDKVVKAARAAGIWVNRADAGDSDFTTPASADVDGVLITASAGGAALSAAVRDHLVERLDRRYSVLAAVMRQIRPRLLATHRPAERTALFRRIASAEALTVAEDGETAVLAWLGL